jgi:hypothetical protein
MGAEVSTPPSRADVLAWVTARAGRALNGAEQADLMAALPAEAGATLVQDFAAAFGIDLQDHDPDLHTIDDGGALRIGWPFPVTRPRGLRLPVSVTLLHAAALAGHWRLDPPAPQTRADWSWANPLILAAGLPLLTLALLWLVRAVF